MNPVALAVFGFIAFIFSVIIHEVSHGVIAEHLGDSTARDAGRITLNPLKHIDPIGSIVLPLLLFVFHSPIILGWAKPVPYDPRNLPNPKAAAGKIAASGPISNFILAIIFAILTRVVVAMNGSVALADLFAMVVLINLSLGIFNLVPIPPLDGSKVLFAFLPATRTGYAIMAFLERYGLIVIFAFLLFAGGLLLPVVSGLFTLLTGQSLM